MAGPRRDQQPLLPDGPRPAARLREQPRELRGGQRPVPRAEHQPGGLVQPPGRDGGEPPHLPGVLAGRGRSAAAVPAGAARGEGDPAGDVEAGQVEPAVEEFGPAADRAVHARAAQFAGQPQGQRVAVLGRAEEGAGQPVAAPGPGRGVVGERAEPQRAGGGTPGAELFPAVGPAGDQGPGPVGAQPLQGGAQPARGQCERRFLGPVEHHQQRPSGVGAQRGELLRPGLREARPPGRGGEPAAQRVAEGAVARGQVGAAQPQGRQRLGGARPADGEGREFGGAAAAAVAEQHGERVLRLLAAEAVGAVDPVGGEFGDPSGPGGGVGELGPGQPQRAAEVERRPVRGGVGGVAGQQPVERAVPAGRAVGAERDGGRAGAGDGAHPGGDHGEHRAGPGVEHGRPGERGHRQVEQHDAGDGAHPGAVPAAAVLPAERAAPGQGGRAVLPALVRHRDGAGDRPAPDRQGRAGDAADRGGAQQGQAAVGEQVDALRAEHPGLPAGGVQHQPGQSGDRLVRGDHRAVPVGDEAEAAQSALLVPDPQQRLRRIPREAGVRTLAHPASPPAGPHPDPCGTGVRPPYTPPVSLPPTSPTAPRTPLSPHRFTPCAPGTGVRRTPRVEPPGPLPSAPTAAPDDALGPPRAPARPGRP
ncbi:hypothetical protein ACFQ2M_28670 [Kitasatospora saccharophila]|uniref:hypothetical protein n=1 Tax=Kitasatospora saccharophila TaxID=407973 RepID=UPI003629D2A6